MITYMATNSINGMFYVGSTVDFEKRKRSHLNSNEPYPFQRAFAKHPEKFEWTLFEDDSEEPILEQALLDMWYGKGMCYNLNPYATRPPSWEGKTHSRETREKMSKSNNKKGKKESEQSRKNKSISNSGLRNPMYGKKHSQETRKKIGLTRAGKHWWINTFTSETILSDNCPGKGWIPGRGKLNKRVKPL